MKRVLIAAAMVAAMVSFARANELWDAQARMAENGIPQEQIDLATSKCFAR